MKGKTSPVIPEEMEKSIREWMAGIRDWADGVHDESREKNKELVESALSLLSKEEQRGMAEKLSLWLPEEDPVTTPLLPVLVRGYKNNRFAINIDYDPQTDPNECRVQIFFN